MKEIKNYKADLHIHTPASKCYKGNKTEDEYLQIITSATKKGLDVIAITDHNSIEGYKTLIKYKEKILNDIDTQIQRNKDMVHKLRLNDTTTSCFSMKGEMRCAS